MIYRNHTISYTNIVKHDFTATLVLEVGFEFCFVFFFMSPLGDNEITAHYINEVYANEKNEQFDSGMHHSKR